MGSSIEGGSGPGRFPLSLSSFFLTFSFFHSCFVGVALLAERIGLPSPSSLYLTRKHHLELRERGESKDLGRDSSGYSRKCVKL